LSPSTLFLVLLFQIAAPRRPAMPNRFERENVATLRDGIR